MDLLLGLFDLLRKISSPVFGQRFDQDGASFGWRFAACLSKLFSSDLNVIEQRYWTDRSEDFPSRLQSEQLDIVGSSTSVYHDLAIDQLDSQVLDAPERPLVDSSLDGS